VRAAPGAIESVETDDAGYVSVHSRLAGPAAPLNEIFSAAEVPEATAPAARLNDAV